MAHPLRHGMVLPAVLVATAAVLLASAGTMDHPAGRLIGRLHVVGVHFPIGLLIVAAIIETWTVVKRRPISPSARVCLAFGAVASMLAVFSGLMNSWFDQSIIDDLMAKHRLVGIGAAVLTLGAWGASARAAKAGTTGALVAARGLLALAAVGVGLAGHLGGSVTHGEDYLTGPFKAMFGGGNTPSPTAPQSRGGREGNGGRDDPPTRAGPGRSGAVDFATEVWPILDEQCFDCHNDVKKKGRLRLDSREAMLTGGKSGPAIKPGDSAASLLMRRVRGEGGKDQMPLDQPPLTAEQIEIFRQWIDAGAPWPAGRGAATPDSAPSTATPAHASTGDQSHWSFIVPRRPAPPPPKAGVVPAHPIDAFVLANLARLGLQPSPPADKPTLIRRVSLDLIGLPPTMDEIAAFEADSRPDAYERLVDRLLASPAYGERWARPWLDLARYADSLGHEKDNTWSMWPYRDWVINALNADMPFDQFTIEQLAGDLLPSPTQQQRVATGFHRCSMINEEGGVDPEEARIVTVADRTDTTATVWLGTTLACARCHDHKFDPITTRDYYAFYAFFNSTPIETKWVGDGETQIISETISLPRGDEAALEPFARSLEAQAAGGAPLADHARSIRALLAQRPTTQVMKELPEPRITHILTRGNFQTPGEVVEPSTPHVLPPLRLAPNQRANRLALAQWIVSRDNPLTARVHANRLWSALFGRGIVETEEDFGTRGSKPAHPEVLDWLAVEFMERGWSQKALLRTIVTSSTYRQASLVTPRLLERDPHNVMLARAPRFRLEAETIRDQALAIAGLLSGKIGGPSVFPSQPPRIWGHAYNGADWTPSTGENAHRRGIYTFWKRATPYPAFAAFDAPSRQVTCTRRSRTNTPLQALVTLNDPAFIECARALAMRVLSHGPANDEAAMTWAFRAATARAPTPEELGRLVLLLQQERHAFEADESRAAEFIGRGKKASASSGPRVSEIAAWTVVANVLLNLDEALTKG